MLNYPTCETVKYLKKPIKVNVSDPSIRAINEGDPMLQ